MQSFFKIFEGSKYFVPLSSVDDVSKRKIVKKSNVLEGALILAFKQSEVEVTSSLKKFFTKNGKTLDIVQTKIDPYILGGFVLIIDDMVFDGSVRRNLEIALQ